MIHQLVRGPMLIPDRSGAVRYIPDGALASDAAGTLTFAGPWEQFQHSRPADAPAPRLSDGVILPPLIDAHIHIPQHPIRGRFIEGIPPDAPQGRLLAGLQRNVFPAEARCHEEAFARTVVETFLADTLANGVVGGAAYMTPSVIATAVALEMLPQTWSVGLVLMNQNCPPDLCTDPDNLERDVTQLAEKYGPRLIITDRFAVAVDTPLRRRGSALAAKHQLRTQTHLNEQVAEKNFVEHTLYPDASSYTDVYLRDGLLDHRCILAHCIHMRDDEWRIARDTGSVIAHCPTSNLLLGSGVMNLDEVDRYNIPYAIATDVGASPTVSMLAEMARFLAVHQGTTTRATPTEALYRATLAPAEILGLNLQFGHLEPGHPMSFIEAESRPSNLTADADTIIRSLLPTDLETPEPCVRRVTLAGRTVFERNAVHA